MGPRVAVGRCVTDPFDWKNPQYAPIFRERFERLQRIRAEPECLPALKRYYQDHPAAFICDWGQTSDPRNVDVGLPVNIPFILFPRQIEWIDWFLQRWRLREPGVTVKSRDMGISWLSIALSCTMCLFHDNMAVGFGSRKLELVDKLGDPSCLFWKARTFLEMLPDEFTGGWRARTHSSERLLRFNNGSTIAGEGGDEIGRGARTTWYLVDEAASIERPALLDASLSQTTNCRQDVSTPKGSANSFAEKVRSWPDERVFRFHWRDDPRKDEAWYAKQVEELDPVTLAQEVDMDFAASTTGVLIPSAWVQSAIDLHVHLGIEPSGVRAGALDVADEGIDMNAFGASYGWLLTHLEEWSGKGADIFATTERAFMLADEHSPDGFRYDADGLGAGVRGDARVINERRKAASGGITRPRNVEPFRGSGAVDRPDGQDVKGRRNQDFFKNLKAQSGWTLRRRFEQSFRARNGQPYDPDMIISIPRDLPHRAKLVVELSQPTYSLDNQGKIVIDKKPDDQRSPNLYDTVMMLLGRQRRIMTISDEAIRRARAA